MSPEPVKIDNKQKDSLKAYCTVSGKLDKIIERDGRNGIIYEHLIVIPAEDTFNHPTTIPVKSYRRLGNSSEILNLVPTLRGRSWAGQKDRNYSVELWVE